MAERRRIKRRHVDELVAAANPAANADVPDSPRDVGARKLLRAITAESHHHNGKHASVTFAPRPRSRSRLFSMAAATIASMAILAATLSLTLGTTGPASASVLVQSVQGVPLEADLPAAAIVKGSVDWSKVPDYVSAVSHGAVVGYVRKADLRRPTRPNGPLLDPVPSCGTEGIDVYDATHGLIGHIYSGAGYTPLGARAQCSPIGRSASPSPEAPVTNPPPSAGALTPLGVAIPDVRYEPLSQARRQLVRAGFSVKVIMVASTAAVPGTVVAEAPLPIADSLFTRGSEVTLSVAS